METLVWDGATNEKLDCYDACEAVTYQFLNLD